MCFGVKKSSASWVVLYLAARILHLSFYESLTFIDSSFALHKQSNTIANISARMFIWWA